MLNPFLIICFAQLLNANDLFESPFKKIEFQTNNIEDTNFYKCLEITGWCCLEFNNTVRKPPAGRSPRFIPPH